MKLTTMIGMIAILMFCQKAAAQESHAVDLFAGYSYTRVNTSTLSGLGSFPLNGGEAGLSYEVKPWVTAVADFGVTAVAHHASNIVGITTHGEQNQLSVRASFSPFSLAENYAVRARPLNSAQRIRSWPKSPYPN
jgi:hypothetical protein